MNNTVRRKVLTKAEKTISLFNECYYTLFFNKDCDSSEVLAAIPGPKIVDSQKLADELNKRLKSKDFIGINPPTKFRNIRGLVHFDNSALLYLFKESTQTIKDLLRVIEHLQSNAPDEKEREETEHDATL